MTLPELPGSDDGQGRQQAILGTGLIAAAAIGLSAFESIAQRQLVFTGLARAVLILLVGILTFRGRRWAAWVFAFFAVAGAVAGFIGLANTRFNAIGLVLFGPVIAANLAGLALLYLSPPARGFIKRQQALAPSTFLPPRPPNG